MVFSTRKRIEPGINMTPLIDAVLLLLIFFMVSSSFVTQPGIKVDLPEATTAPIDTPREFTVAVLADGGLYLDGEAVTLAELERTLTGNATSLNRRETLVIQADKNALLGTAVAVMELGQAAGLSLAIATTPRQAQSGGTSGSQP